MARAGQQHRKLLLDSSHVWSQATQLQESAKQVPQDKMEPAGQQHGRLFGTLPVSGHGLHNHSSPRNTLSQEKMNARAGQLISHHLAADVGKGVGVEIELREPRPPHHTRLFAVQEDRLSAEPPRNAWETHLKKITRRRHKLPTAGSQTARFNIAHHGTERLVRLVR